MRMTANVWMHCHWKDKLIFLSIEVIELVSPEVFHVCILSAFITLTSTRIKYLAGSPSRDCWLPS